MKLKLLYTHSYPITRKQTNGNKNINIQYECFLKKEKLTNID